MRQIARKLLQTSHIVQVSWEMTDEKTRNREIRALVESMKELELADSCIITHLQEETLQMDGKQINLIPAWKYLLGPNEIVLPSFCVKRPCIRELRCSGVFGIIATSWMWYFPDWLWKVSLT